MDVPGDERFPLFEWNPEKARLNYVKHGIDFGEAAHVFADPLNTTIHDIEHSDDENRWITMGNVNGKVIVVVHVYPNDLQESPVRIISARLATRSEVHYYEEGSTDERRI